MKTKDFKNKLLYILITFIVIYSSGSMLLTLNSNYSFVFINKLIPMALFIVLIFGLILKKEKLETNVIIGGLAIAIILLLNLIIKEDDLLTLFLRLSLIFSSYLLSKKLNEKTFMKYFLYWIRIIAAVSLLGYFIPELFLNISILPNISTSTREEVFKFGLLTNVPYLGHQQTRNWGPFWEPGVYQAFLILAMFFSLKLKNKYFMLDFILLSVTIITTKSTTGYISLIVFLIYTLTYLFRNERKRIGLAISMFVVLFLIFAFDNKDNYLNVFTKLDDFYDKSRWISTKEGFNIFIKNPILGYGPSNVQNHPVFLQYQDKISLTNTLVYIFASFGTIIGMFYLINYVKFIKSFFNKDIILSIIITVLFLILIMTENFSASIIFNYFLFFRFNKGSGLADEK